MKKISNILFILFFTVTVSAKLTTTQNNLSTDYTVQSGDTLYIIAKKHHTTVAEVLSENQLGLKAVIRVGQMLKVPLNTYFPERKTEKIAPSKTKIYTATSPKKSAASDTVEYTVQSGDTFFTIARIHHTSISAMLKANDMDRGAMIKVGQRLSVPVNTYFPDKKTATAANASTQISKPKNVTPASTPQKGTYAVQTGDTLFSVARKNHIVISKLMKINGIGLGDTLRVGQVLKVSSRSTFVPTAMQTKTSTGGTSSSREKASKKKQLPVGAMPSYTVKKGDTLWKIARKHHLTLAQIRKLNKMRKKDRIRTGMILAVGKAVQPKSKTYKVKRGDTLWLIAKKNKMSTKQLRKLNHMSRKDRIHTGMRLALTKDAVLKRDKKTRSIVAKLKKKGAKKSEIEAVLAKVKKSKKKHPNISAILAQVKREKNKKQIKTPLRISKKKRKKSSRYGSAAAMLNGRSSGSSSKWSRNSKTIRIAKRYLGRRYVWGAVGPSSFDCSGFTQYVMRKSKGVRLPRVSRKQAYYGKYISRRNLRAGDLIFFDTSRRRRGYVNHVGIYIGNNKFIHASSGKHRVVITSLSRPFYSARFKWGRRVN